MGQRELETLAELAECLAVMMEIAYLPEDAEEIFPQSVGALREAQLILSTYDHKIPETLGHWLGKVDASRIQ